MAHALAGALAPERDDDALAAGLQVGDVLGHGLEYVAAGLGALGGEIAALLRADVDDRPMTLPLSLPVRHGERREPRQCRRVEPLAPVRFGEIEPVGRQRLVGRTGAAFGEHLLARLVIVLDLREA